MQSNTTNKSNIKLLCPDCEIELIFDPLIAVSSTYSSSNNNGLYCPNCEYKI